MRNFLLLVVSVFSLLAAVGLLSRYNASSHKAPAEEFLRLIGDNKPREAFDSASSGFQQDFKWENFRRFVVRFHLMDYQPGSFRVTGGRTTYTRASGLVILLAGDTALRDGTHFQTTIKLRQESDRWKVNYIWVQFPHGYLEHSSPLPTPLPAGTDAAFESKPLTLNIRPIQIDPSRSAPATSNNERRDATFPASASPSATPAPSR